VFDTQEKKKQQNAAFSLLCMLIALFTEQCNSMNNTVTRGARFFFFFQ
jgi:hypothetical protein